MARRFLSEAEQRARIREAALKHEADLEARLHAGEKVGKQLDDVWLLLNSIGRKPGYTETVAIRERKAFLKEHPELGEDRSA